MTSNDAFAPTLAESYFMFDYDTPTPGGDEATLRGDAAAGPAIPTADIPKVIGLDLSLTSTGIAGRGWTDRTKPAARLTGPARLDWIRDVVLSYVTGSALVVIEGPSYGNQGRQRQSGHHERAGLWWLIVHALWSRDIPYAVMSPAGRAKYATGSGTSSKDDVVREVTKRFPWFDGDNNEADALVLCAAGYDHLGAPMTVMPKTHRAALDAVAWPEAPDA